MNRQPTIPTPDISKAIAGHNSYGLDLSDPNYIIYSKENINIEVIGGINDVLLSSLRVSIKVYKKNEPSPLRIYRSTQIDLFNQSQVEYHIGQICEKVQLEKVRFTNIFYDFIETLESYRKNKHRYTSPELHVPKHIQEEATTLLQEPNVITTIKELLGDAGVTDSTLGLQLYIISLSRITDTPLHGIVMAPQLLAHELLSELIPCIPKERIRELTTMSKHALSYTPHPDYLNHTTLVLHQLASIKEQGNTLLEYIQQGSSKRLVTQTDTKTGGYEATRKDVTGTINVMSYSNSDAHPAFYAKDTLCIPLNNTNSIKELLYEKQVKQLAGLSDTNKQVRAQELLQQIQRSLEPMQIYNPVIEQVDISRFFGGDLKSLSQYLKLVNLVTLLYQKHDDVLLTDRGQTLEVKPQYMKLVLELYRELWLKKEDELYFNVRGSFNRIKGYLKKSEPDHYLSTSFKLKDIRKAVGRSPVTVQRHLNQLELYGKIERTGGNNKTGYEYQVRQWKDDDNKREAYEQLLQQL